MLVCAQRKKVSRTVVQLDDVRQKPTLRIVVRPRRAETRALKQIADPRHRFEPAAGKDNDDSFARTDGTRIDELGQTRGRRSGSRLYKKPLARQRKRRRSDFVLRGGNHGAAAPTDRRKDSGPAYWPSRCDSLCNGGFALIQRGRAALREGALQGRAVRRLNRI